MRTKNLTDEERQSLGLFMLENSIKGRPKNGATNEAALRFGVCMRTIRKTFLETKKQIGAGQHLSLITKKKGKKSKLVIEFDEEIIKHIPVHLRGTVRSFAKQAGVSPSTIWRWIQKGLIKSHTNAIKPLLSQNNQLQRLKYVLTHVQTELNRDSDISFKELDHVVHIDEKWFNITKASNRYYLTQGENKPYRSCQSKRYITKVMFMCAVSRPQFGEDGEVLFDGKIGIFPFTYVEPAQHKSKNKAAGTMATKPIESINKPVIRDCIINKVIPAIKAKWPARMSRHITIQQDNAKPHLSTTDSEFMEAANSDDFNISLRCQPPNSPDLNVLDLGFFRAIQSLQTEMVCQSIDDLVGATVDSYGKLGPQTLDKVFISLQACMKEILKRKGHNDYALPHLGKNRLSRIGQLKRMLTVEDTLIRESIAHLDMFGNTCGLEMLKTLVEIPDLNV